MPKKQKVNDKARIAAELKQKQEWKRKMAFVKTELWPAVIAATDSIDDALQLLSSFNTTIMQEFLANMKTTSMLDMKLVEKLDKKSPKYDENAALLALFNGMSAFEAKEYLEGIRNEINLFVTDELKKRKLDTLIAVWIDEL